MQCPRLPGWNLRKARSLRCGPKLSPMSREPLIYSRRLMLKTARARDLPLSDTQPAGSNTSPTCHRMKVSFSRPKPHPSSRWPRPQESGQPRAGGMSGSTSLPPTHSRKCTSKARGAWAWARRLAACYQPGAARAGAGDACFLWGGKRGGWGGGFCARVRREAS